MSGYFDRGATAGGHDQGYFNREDVIGPEGVGSGVTGPGPVADLDVDPERRDAASQDATNRSGAAEGRGGARGAAIPPVGDTNFDETAGATSPVRADESYSQIIEDSGDGPKGISSAAPARDTD